MDADEQEFVDYEGDDDYEQQLDAADEDLIEEEAVDYEDEAGAADEQEGGEGYAVKPEEDHTYGDEELQGLEEGRSGLLAMSLNSHASYFQPHSRLCALPADEEEQQPSNQRATPPAVKEEAAGGQEKKDRVLTLTKETSYVGTCSCFICMSSSLTLSRTP